MSFLSDLFGESHIPALESSKYDDLFRDLIDLSPDVADEVADTITRAQESLGKPERVIWYLRLWRIGLAQALAHDGPIVGRIATEYARRAKVSEAEAEAAGWQVYNDDDLLGELDHFLRLPIPAVRSVRFGYADPDALIGELRSLEKKWHEAAKGGFEDHHAEEVLRFANGLAWYDLKRPTCALEAEAMGHHGNGGRDGSGDTLLSLRQTFAKGDTLTHQPILTFVLDKNGFLSEMKGRFGEKPEQAYHNEIVALLRLPMIHGIRGGGAKPHTNFAMTDLDEDTAAELVAEKPELAGLSGVFAKRGIRAPLVLEMLHQRLSELGIAPPMLSLHPERDVFTIERWRDAASFFTAMDDGICRAAADLIAGEGHTLSAGDGLTEQDVRSTLVALDPDAYRSLMRIVGIRAIEPGAPQYETALRLANARLRGTPIEDAIREALSGARRVSGATKDAIQDRLHAYTALGWRFQNPYQHVTLDDDLIAPVAISIRAADLVSIVTADQDGDDDFVMILEDIRHDGWFGIDRSALSRIREKKGLSPEVSGEASLDSDPVFREMKGQIEQIDYHKAANILARLAGL